MAKLAEWFFNDGASGQTPTTVADSSPNSNDLTVDFNGTSAEWASNAAGGYLNVTAAAQSGNVNAGRMAMNAGGLGAALEGAQQFVVFVKTEGLGLGAYPESPIVHIGPNGGTDLEVTVADVGVAGMISFRAAGGQFRFYGYADTIFAFVFDGANATDADKIKCYKRSGATNSQVTGVDIQEYVAPTANSMSGINDATTFLTMMQNAADNNNATGGLKFVRFESGILTQQEIFDAFDALAANDDADPLAVAPVTITAGPTITNLSYSGFNVNVTADQDSTIDILIEADGATQPSEAAFDAATFGGAGTANVSFNDLIDSGFTPGNDYEVWVRCTDSGGNDAYGTIGVSVPVQVPAITSVSGDNVILDGETTIGIAWDNGATGTTGATLNGVAQGNYSVTSDVLSTFDFVWPNALYGNVLVLNVDSGYETHAVTHLPAAGRSYVTLGAGYNVNTSDLTAIPDLVTSDQVEYENTTTTGNPVVIDENGMVTITTSVSATVGNITARAIDSVDGTLGNWVVFPGVAPDLIPNQFDLGADATGQDTGFDVVRQFTLAGVDPGENVTVNATGSAQVASDGVNYGASITVQNGATIYVRVTSSGSYETSVSGGCSINGISDSFNVITRAANAPTITQQPVSQTVTEGQNFNFVMAATGAVSYQWYDASDDSAISGETGTAFTRASVIGDNGLSVYCVATSAEGGTSQTVTVTLTVNSSQQQTPGLNFAANAFINSLAHPSNASVSRPNEVNAEVWILNGGSLVSYTSNNTTDASSILNSIPLAGQTIGTNLICVVRFANGDGVPPFQVSVSDIS